MKRKEFANEFLDTTEIIEYIENLLITSYRHRDYTIPVFIVENINNYVRGFLVETGVVLLESRGNFSFVMFFKCRDGNLAISFVPNEFLKPTFCTVSCKLL